MILVVDDDRLFVALLKRTLSDQPVRWAANLAEARRMLSQTPFDLVLLDLGLPDGHGVHLLATWGNLVPTIVMTGFSPFPDCAAMRAHGARACVDKDELVGLSGTAMLRRWAHTDTEISLTG